MAIKFNMLHPDMTPEHLGYIPFYFDDKAPQMGITAEAQMKHGYRQTAGCEPFEWKGNINRFTMGENGALKYPGDPAMKPLADYQLGDEKLRFYDSAIFSIQQKDGSFRVWRLD